MKNTAVKMNNREQSMRNPRNSAVGKKAPALVIAIGAAPTLKPAKVNNSKALKTKK